MLTEGVDYDEAYLRVRGGRPICAPNTGFTCSLLEWERRRQAVSDVNEIPVRGGQRWESKVFGEDASVPPSFLLVVTFGALPKEAEFIAVRRTSECDMTSHDML